jgi:hypothetical protein
MVFKGVIDCSANPNYPAANAGDVYKVSVAGKIGGGSGPNVEAGDSLYCLTDGTSAGTHAGVGANWSIFQANIDIDTDGTLAANSDAKVASQKAVKTYVDAHTGGAQPFAVVPFFPGSPTASQLLGVFPAPAGITTLTFAAAIAGSSGKALAAATADTDIDVRKNATTAANGTSVGTVRFAAGATVPTFIAASGFTLTGGTDYLSLWAPATPDATLANFAIALYATR